MHKTMIDGFKHNAGANQYVAANSDSTARHTKARIGIDKRARTDLDIFRTTERSDRQRPPYQCRTADSDPRQPIKNVSEFVAERDSRKTVRQRQKQ